MTPTRQAQQAARPPALSCGSSACRWGRAQGTLHLRIHWALLQGGAQEGPSTLAQHCFGWMGRCQSPGDLWVGHGPLGHSSREGLCLLLGEGAGAGKWLRQVSSSASGPSAHPSCPPPPGGQVSMVNTLPGSPAWQGERPDPRWPVVSLTAAPHLPLLSGGQGARHPRRPVCSEPLPRRLCPGGWPRLLPPLASCWGAGRAPRPGP